IVATPVANRPGAEVEPLIGFFVNLVVLRTRLHGSIRVVDLCESVRTTVLDAFEHQQAPFEKVVEDLSPTRDGGRNPLARVVLTLQPPSFADLHLHGLEISRIDLIEQVTRFDLEMHVRESPEGLELNAIYSTELFEPDTIRRLLRQYARILESMSAHRHSRIDDLPLVDGDERALLLGWASSGS